MTRIWLDSSSSLGGRSGGRRGTTPSLMNGQYVGHNVPSICQVAVSAKLSGFVFAGCGVAQHECGTPWTPLRSSPTSRAAVGRVNPWLRGGQRGRRGMGRPSGDPRRAWRAHAATGRMFGRGSSGPEWPEGGSPTDRHQGLTDERPLQLGAMFRGQATPR